MGSFLAHSLALFAALAVLPQLVGDFWAYTLALYFLYAIATLGIGLTWGQAGFLSLGQAMFVGIGAYLSGFALINFKDSWLLVLLIPGAAIVPGLLAFGIGLLVFRGRTRSGPFFALITLAMTLLAFQIANSWNSVTGGFNGLKNIPGLPGVDGFTGFYYVSAAALGIAILGTAWLLSAPIGILWQAVAQNERRVAFFGFRVNVMKAVVFGISGLLAGSAGALYAPQQNLVTPELCGFLFSADLVIWAAVGGRTTLYGPVIGAIVIGALTAELRDQISYWEVVLAGIFIVVVLYLPQGLVGFVEPPLRWLFRKRGETGLPVAEKPREAGPAALQVDRLSAAAGDVRILQDLGFKVEEPGVYCLIGPNGAGKTSSFNVITGEMKAAGGTVRFGGTDVTGRSGDRLTRLGVGRKFQIPSIFPDHTVGENLRIALWGSRARPLDLLKHSLLRWRSPILDELEKRFPFLAEHRKPARDLSHGQRQILELAMVLCLEPRLLLLDEPSAGLSPAETREVIDAIRWATERLGASTIVIEHDMAFVRELADHVFVLHQGSLLAEGDVEAIRTNKAVQAVYVGGTK
jgi:branched-chain amino acid transport system permease protein